LGYYIIWYTDGNQSYSTVTVKVTSLAKGSQYNNDNSANAIVTYNGKEYEIKEVDKKIFIQGNEAIAYFLNDKLYANSEEITFTDMGKKIYFEFISPKDIMYAILIAGFLVRLIITWRKSSKEPKKQSLRKVEKGKILLY